MKTQKCLLFAGGKIKFEMQWSPQNLTRNQSYEISIKNLGNFKNIEKLRLLESITITMSRYLFNSYHYELSCTQSCLKLPYRTCNTYTHVLLFIAHRDTYTRCCSPRTARPGSQLVTFNPFCRYTCV